MKWFTNQMIHIICSDIIHPYARNISHSSICYVFIYYLTKCYSFMFDLIYMFHYTFHDMCDLIHGNVRHNCFIYTCVTWPIHTCDMTHLYVWHDSFICVIWLIHMCDMTHSYVWHDSFICVPYSCICHSILFIYISYI